MNSFREDIEIFLKKEGFDSIPYSGLTGNPDIISVCGCDRLILPVRITAATLEEAAEKALKDRSDIEDISRLSGFPPVIITEDRWRHSPEATKGRLLAHLKRHTQIYARNCEVRRIDKPTASAFLADAHSYGDAACRYRYGLFLKRHTGHLAAKDGNLPAGTLVAVATFSNARKWIKSGQTIRSYEWTRYASLPGVRVSGGMGKLLKTFTKDVNPDDIMTYADLEWSEGEVYEQLGFVSEGGKSPVSFLVDTVSWERKAIADPVLFQADEGAEDVRFRFHTNFGSAKYRMKLTDYENNQ